MNAQRSLFDARREYRDRYFGLHLWAVVRGDCAVADECAWRANAVDAAIRAVHA